MNRTLATSLKTLLATVAVPFFAVACCSGVENPDDQLLIEIQDEPALSTPDAPKNLCGANVVADTDGEQIELEEVALDNSDGTTRCAYRGTVNPDVRYVIRVSKDDRVVTLDAESNPACSTATDPDDTDGTVALPAKDLNPKNEF